MDMERGIPRGHVSHTRIYKYIFFRSTSKTRPPENEERSTSETRIPSWGYRLEKPEQRIQKASGTIFTRIIGGGRTAA